MKEEWTIEELKELENDLIEVLEHIENVHVTYFDPNKRVDTSQIPIYIEVGADEIGNALNSVRAKIQEIRKQA